jgi:hypothetical protein
LPSLADEKLHSTSCAWAVLHGMLRRGGGVGGKSLAQEGRMTLEKPIWFYETACANMRFDSFPSRRAGSGYFLQ